MRRYEGPFTIIKKVGSVAYKLDLPEAYSKLHHVFYVSMLNPYKRTPSRKIETYPFALQHVYGTNATRLPRRYFPRESCARETGQPSKNTW